MLLVLISWFGLLEMKLVSENVIKVSKFNDEVTVKPKISIIHS